MSISGLITEFETSLQKMKECKINLTPKNDLSSFKAAEQQYALESYRRSFVKLQEVSEQQPEEFRKLAHMLDPLDFQKNLDVVSIMKNIKAIEIRQPKANLSKVPAEIKDEVLADVTEMEKCFESGCYRSCIILCARIIEVCLHAKYYKHTGFDILEKNPGIGLGKLIAKMNEKNVPLDPALAQQIHLVNNVRIFSVHKKQKAFLPTKQKTEAIILYTLDVLNSLF